MSLRTDNLKNYITDILDILVNEMGAPNPGIIHPKDLDAVIRSIPSGGGLEYVMSQSTPSTAKAFITKDTTTIGQQILALEIEDGTTSVGFMQFLNWANITKLTIPDSVTIIEGSAFSGLNKVKTLNIPVGVTSIGSYGFSSMNIVDNPLIIPTGVTVVEPGTFSGWQHCPSVTLHDSITGIGDFAFNGWNSGLSLSIPNSVLTIGRWAFNGWTNGTSLSIGNGITSIGSNAFGGWNALTDCYCYATVPPTIESDTFSGTYIIHLPTASEAAYQVATNWSVYYAEGRLVFDL